MWNLAIERYFFPSKFNLNFSPDTWIWSHNRKPKKFSSLFLNWNQDRWVDYGPSQTLFLVLYDFPRRNASIKIEHCSMYVLLRPTGDKEVQNKSKRETKEEEVTVTSNTLFLLPKTLHSTYIYLCNLIFYFNTLVYEMAYSFKIPWKWIPICPLAWVKGDVKIELLKIFKYPLLRINLNEKTMDSSG
jgi:hypothetical protein